MKVENLKSKIDTEPQKNNNLMRFYRKQQLIVERRLKNRQFDEFESDGVSDVDEVGNGWLAT